MPESKIDLLLKHDETCPDQSDAYRPQCIHDDLGIALRCLLIFDEDDPLPTDDEYLLDLVRDDMTDAHPDILPLLHQLVAALDEVRNDEYQRDYFSMLRLDYSLCPMHGGDYAACFDDENPECDQIRAMFPAHDT
jgi:hypothetical protein